MAHAAHLRSASSRASATPPFGSFGGSGGKKLFDERFEERRLDVAEEILPKALPL